MHDLKSLAKFDLIVGQRRLSMLFLEGGACLLKNSTFDPSLTAAKCCERVYCCTWRHAVLFEYLRPRKTCLLLAIWKILSFIILVLHWASWVVAAHLIFIVLPIILWAFMKVRRVESHPRMMTVMSRDIFLKWVLIDCAGLRIRLSPMSYHNSLSFFLLQGLKLVF